MKADLLEEAIDRHIYYHEDISIQKKCYSRSEKKMLCVFVLKINKTTIKMGEFVVVSDEMYNRVTHRVYRIRNKDGVEELNKIVTLPYIGVMESIIKDSIDKFDYLGDCQVEEYKEDERNTFTRTDKNSLADREQYIKNIYADLFTYTATKLWSDD